MRILITGSCGFIGAHYVQHFLNNTDWNVVGIDSFNHRGDAARLDNSHHSRYAIHCHDLNAPISKYLAAQIGHVDYIINMASQSDVPRSLADPVPFVQNNVNLTLHMLEYARSLGDGLKRFIQISTDEVYGEKLVGASVEWDAFLPSSPYAASKVSQEALGVAWWRAYNVPLQIVNCMNLFGERQDTEKYIPMLISRINQNKLVHVHGSEEFIGTRSYLHARNFAHGVHHLLKRPHRVFEETDSVVMPDRYNIVGDTEIDNLALAVLISSMLGKPLRWEFMDFQYSRAGHDRRYALDGVKMASTGWEAPLPFEESLRRVINWTLEHPEWME